MDFVYEVLNQVNETIPWTTSLVSSLQLSEKVDETTDDMIRNELFNKYGLAIQTPQYGKISSLPYASTDDNNNNNSFDLLVNGFTRRHFIDTFEENTYCDQFINDLSSIICKYYIRNRLKLMSGMNKHELQDNAIFASSNNCMFVITSMMIDKKQMTETKKNKVIEFQIQSKHSTSLNTLSFGIIGIQRKYYHQVLKDISSYFTNNNSIGGISGWDFMLSNVARPNDKYKLLVTDSVELFGCKTPHFVMVKNSMISRKFATESVGAICQDDIILIKIGHGNCVKIYHNKKRLLYSNKLDGDKYLYFPFVGDTHNNNFQFQLSQH